MMMKIHFQHIGLLVEQNFVLEDDRLFILSKQNAIFSTHNTLISVGMFQQGIIGAFGTIGISPTQFKFRSPYFLLRTNKELAMKSRRGKARRISAASFPGCEFFLTTSVPPFDSSISTFLLLGGSPETQV